MTRTLRARLGAAVLGLALLAPMAAATPASAAAADFPAGYTGYHTYAEMVADIDAVVAAHPTSSGRSRSARATRAATIWAVKISDNVAVDEHEPEVLFDGLTHSDEHMGLEMTLKIMHWLVDGYGTSTPGSRASSTTARSGSSSRSTPTEPSTTSSSASSTSGARTASRTRARPRSGPTSTATSATTGAAAAGPVEPGRDHVPRLGRVLDPRGAQRPRLPRLARGRRPAADPGRDHVPRGRPARDVAVRLHDTRTSRPT